MKRTVLLFVISFITSVDLSGQIVSRKVLFLGNSYTSVNNLPQLISDIAISAGDTLIFDSYTPGGYTLGQHFADPVSKAKIMSGNWQYVVLQEQSQIPAASDFSPSADQLNTLVKQYNPCARLMFYMTWGRKNGDLSNCSKWPPVCTYKGMDSLLQLRYTEMAQFYGAELSPVGVVWRYIRQNNPGINLYQPDDSHPSAEGSYLAACCFYAAIFKKDPSFITYNFTINSNDAATIRAAAKLMVYDSLAKYSFVKPNPVAEFNYSIGSGINQVLFANNSANVDSYFWNFGDASTSTLKYPSHSYLNNGTYTITLTTSNCDLLNTYQDTDQAIVSFCPFTPSIYPDSLVLCPNQSDSLWTQIYDAYQWLDQNGDTIPNRINRYLPVTGGRYTILATQNGCTEMSTPVDVSVYSGNAGYYVAQTAGPDSSSVCKGDTITLVLNPSKPPYPSDQFVEWFKDGQPVMFPHNDTLVITGSGTYSVRVANDVCPGYYAYGSEIFTYHFKDCTTAITKNSLENPISIYPNPSAGILRIKIPAALVGNRYFLYDLFGQSILNGRLNETATFLDIKNLPAGVYILKINETTSRVLRSDM